MKRGRQGREEMEKCNRNVQLQTVVHRVEHQTSVSPSSVKTQCGVHCELGLKNHGFLSQDLI